MPSHRTDPLRRRKRGRLDGACQLRVIVRLAQSSAKRLHAYLRSCEALVQTANRCYEARFSLLSLPDSDNDGGADSRTALDGVRVYQLDEGLRLHCQLLLRALKLFHAGSHGHSHTGSTGSRGRKKSSDAHVTDSSHSSHNVAAVSSRKRLRTSNSNSSQNLSGSGGVEAHSKYLQTQGKASGDHQVQ